MESAKQETMGITKTGYRKRPGKINFISRKSLSMDSDQDMRGKGNIKKDIGKERVN
jgi:hypothetical protein